MKVALLTTEPLISEWFEKAYPEVSCCKEVNAKFWDAECMIITAYYGIEDEYFEILNLWESFLRIKQMRKRLIVLGWQPIYSSTFNHTRQSPNYLQVSAMPPNLFSWIKEAKHATREPDYPSLPDRNIIPALSKFFQGHGKRAFRKLLIKVLTYIKRIEVPIEEGHHRSYIQKMKEMKEATLLMNQLNTVWEIRKSYFSLMPQYIDIKRYEKLWDCWVQVRDQFKPLEPKLSQQIIQYLNDPIADIARLYKME